MNCYLCGLEAKQSDEGQSTKLVDCSDCGTYRISSLVLKELETRNFEFSKMRDDLHRQRQFNATSVAEINTETAIWS
ncbi:putative Zn finger protein [Pseudomonas sp. W4I3]|nr:putative Zn finger protein [Pseudomonas sp. W4I3]